MNIQSILAFLKQLQANNNKVWMDANKTAYQNARNTLLEIAECLIQGTASFDPDITALQPKDVIFRINRDIRFSKDKTLYKTYMGLYLAKGGKKSEYAGYYLHLAPNNESFIGGGMHEPAPATLHKIRQEIDYNATKLEKIIAAPTFHKFFGRLQGEKLQRPPRGYAAENPHIEWLKHKSLIAMRPLDDHQITRKDFLEEALATFRAMYPLNQFLNAALEE